jgi:hypothetical protein
MKIKNRILLTALCVLPLTVFASCRQTDLIGNTSVRSFSAVIDAAGSLVSGDNSRNVWTLDAPDGAATFLWSRDFGSSLPYDAMLEIDSAPFIVAGLDPEKLPDGVLQDGVLTVGIDFAGTALSYSSEITPLSSYEQIVLLERSHIRYHAALDHFGIDLAGGNMFEWAKDMATNDKDIVFVLNPQIFLDAGVDPAKVTGWVFAKVPVMDADGRAIEVDKFLKPFNLK